MTRSSKRAPWRRWLIDAGSELNLMQANVILSVLGSVFLVLGIWRFLSAGYRMVPQARAWMIVGSVFLLVAAWLNLRT